MRETERIFSHHSYIPNIRYHQKKTSLEKKRKKNKLLIIEKIVIR